MCWSEFRDLQGQVARQRRIPALVATRGRGDAPVAYRTLYRDLYAAVLAESGAPWVVDASKWPAQALALHGPEIDLRVVHLVRDIRGVAYSLRKEHVARPHVTGEQSEMVHSGLTTTAWSWNKTQMLVELLRMNGLPVTRMRYEDLVATPEATVRLALSQLGVPLPSDALDHVGQTTVHLGPSHGLSGNPSRFQIGTVRLRPDTAWQGGLSPIQSEALVVASVPQTIVGAVARLVTPSRRSRRPMNVTAQPASDETAAHQLTGRPLVSVLIPTRGRPELLRLTLRSVLDQDYDGRIECLVVHDQEPPDDSLTKLSTDRRTVTVLNNERTPGLAGARNTAIEHATGAFIATCDDDDVWHSDKITEQLRFLNERPDLLATGSGIRLVFDEDKVVEWPGRADVVDPKALARNRFKELHSSTMFMRRDAYAKAGGYDEELPYGYAEDYDFVLRLTRVGKVGIVKRPLADIRKNVSSWFRGRAANNAEALRYMLQKHPEIQRSRRGHARVLGQIAFAESAAGDRRRGLRTAASALGRYPFAPHAWLAVVQASTGMDPRRLLRGANKVGRGLA